MNDPDRATTVERFWRLMEDRDWRSARALLAPGFVCVWPQSSERFPSADAFMAMNEAHPAPNWHVASIAVQSTDEEVVAEVVVTTDTGVDLAIGFYVVRGDLIECAREYWVERSPEPTPAWRAAWTEAIEPER